MRSAWPVVRHHVQAALDDRERAGHPFDGFFGPTTFAATIDEFYSPDLVVHAWDVAASAELDEPRPIDRDEMRMIGAGLESIGDTMRQPGLFGAAIPVPDDAEEQTRFLAFLGRRA